MHLSLLHSLTAEVEAPQEKLGKILLATPVATVDVSEGPPDGGERPAKKSSAQRFLLKENCAPAAPHQKKRRLRLRRGRRLSETPSSPT